MSLRTISKKRVACSCIRFSSLSGMPSGGSSQIAKVNQTSQNDCEAEPKVQSYLTRCDEVWLLIIADGAHISSTLDFDVEPSATLHTQFARVLLYSGDSQSVFRLK